MNKITLLFVGVFGLSNIAFGADIGFGISFGENDESIYVPVNISEAVMMEANIRYWKADVNSVLVKSEVENIELGVGIFGKMPTTDNARLYVGGRVSYVDSKFEMSATVRDDSDGYRVSPTIGFEYLITENLSIAGEAEWYYLDLEGSSTTSTDKQDDDRTQTGTDNRLLVRYYF